MTQNLFYLTPLASDLVGENKRDSLHGLQLDPKTFEQARQGDSAALREVLASVSPGLLRLASRLCGNAAEAEDLVEEALYRGGMKLRKLRQPSALYAWFRSILIHAWRDALRRRKREFVRFDGDLTPDGADVATSAAASSASDPVALAETAEVREAIGVALGRLPVAQRAVLTLRFHEELSVAEIASVLETTPARVKANLWHGRRRLQTLLKNFFDGRTI